MKTIRILILEDDLETLAVLAECLVVVQKRYENVDIALTILAEYTQVEEYLNPAKENIYDIILLDRDCKACGSFHCLDFSKYPVEKVIAISSVPPYNEEMIKRGVTRVVHKDYQALDEFVDGVNEQLDQMIKKLILE